jgi:hypothetical protein
MYFADLTPYTYFPSEPGSPPALNVGWLERGHRYPRGAVTEEFLDRLFAACRSPVAATRGFHVCDLCPPPSERVPWPTTVRRAGVELSVGSAEIRVRGGDGRVYAAPNLVYHYVEAHRYLPPEEFVAAVIGGRASDPPPP